MGNRQTERVKQQIFEATDRRVAIPHITDKYYNADGCVRALDAAVAAMDPEMEVHKGILHLIADFVPYGGFAKGK